MLNIEISKPTLHYKLPRTIDNNFVFGNISVISIIFMLIFLNVFFSSFVCTQFQTYILEFQNVILFYLPCKADYIQVLPHKIYMFLSILHLLYA